MVLTITSSRQERSAHPAFVTVSPMAADAVHGSVLIVEELADWPNGHFSVRFAQLAQAYVDLGYDVDVLTSVGWRRSREQSVPFSVHRFGPFTTFLRKIVLRLCPTDGLSGQRDRRDCLAR